MFYLFFIRLFHSRDLIIVLNGLTWVDPSYFLFFFKFHYSILDRLRIKFHNLFIIVLWGYMVLWLEHEFCHLDLLNHIIFSIFLRGNLGVMIWITGPSALDFIFVGMFSSHDLGHRFSELTQLTHFFCFFFSILSFNIVFHWELDFMICFNLVFIRISRLHDLRMVLNELIRVDSTYFYVIL